MKYAPIFDAALVLLGAGAVVTGVAQVHLPAAWIVGGLACIALGIYPARRS